MPGCGKAGESAGSTCAIDAEGLKRRPPSKMGGLCHEFTVEGLGFRVMLLDSYFAVLCLSVCLRVRLGLWSYGLGWGLATHFELGGF